MRILILLLLSISLNAQTYLCEGESKSCTINATTGTAPFTYKWTSPLGAISTSQTVNVTMEGVYLWETTDALGCKKTGTYEVFLEPEPTFVINAYDRCANEAQIINTTGVPSGYTFSWEFGSGSIPVTSTSSNISVVYTTGGTKTIDLEITKNGCTYSTSTTINISQISGSISCE